MADVSDAQIEYTKRMAKCPLPITFSPSAQAPVSETKTAEACPETDEAASRGRLSVRAQMWTFQRALSMTPTTQ